MATTGPQRYPGASTAYWYGAKYPGSPMESNVVVWHSTEGTSLPTYSGGAEAPNFTAKPDFAAKRLVWYQHFDFDRSARALVNTSGGVETNTLNVVQVEIVGTCDPATHKKWGSTPHLYTPELPDWAIRDLAAFAKWAHANHGVPLTSGVNFVAYPASYGSGAGVRMTGAQWNAFTGHCGHQHVPENDHGDPGAFPMAAILAAAKGGAPSPTDQSKETDVPLTDADVKKILTTDGLLAAPTDASDYKTNPYWALGSHIQDQTQRIRDTQKSVAALTATVKTLAGLAGAGVDTAAVVSAVEAAIRDAVIKVDVDINQKD